MSSIKIENTLNEALKKKYQITIPQKFIEVKIDDVVRKAQKNYRQNGFRPGKVPNKVIKDQYGKSILLQEAEKIINESIQNIIKENDLKLALRPKVDLKDFNEQEDIKCDLEVELLPEVPTINLEKIKLTKFSAKISDKEIEEELQKTLKNKISNWAEKEGKAKKGDAVNIDYIGKINDVEFEGGTAKDYQLELGSKSFIDDFEDQLVGKKKGDDVRVKVRFPKDYQQDKFADKKAIFEVKINKVLKIEMPEINDEIIKENFKLDNLETLKEKVKNNLEEGRRIISENIFKKEAFDFLNKKYDFEVTTGLIDLEFKKHWDKVEKELKENPDKFKNEKEKKKAQNTQRENSIKDIRTGFILSAIIEQNKIEASQEDIDANINKKSAQFPGQEELFKKYYQENKELLNNVKGEIVEQKIVNLILEKSNIKNKNVSIKDLEKEHKKVYKK